MEFGLVTAHSVFPTQPLRSRKTCRYVRAGYRPVATQAGTLAPCTSVYLLCRSYLKVRRGSVIVATTINASSQAFLPSNWFKAARFAHLGPAEAGPLNQTLGVTMKPHLRIVRHPYEEPYYLNLEVSASNGNLPAGFEYYKNARAILEWASVLEKFPRHSSDVFLHEIGSEIPEDRTVYYFRLRVFNTNSAGGCAIQVRFNNNQNLPDREIFDFCIRAEPAQINRLGKLLRTFAEIRHEALEWNVTEGELHEFSRNA